MGAKESESKMTQHVATTHASRRLSRSHVRHLSRGLVLSILAFASLLGSVRSQVSPEPKVWECQKTGVQLDLALLPPLGSNPDDEGWWYGDIQGHEWTVNFVPYPVKDYGLTNPSAVIAFLNDYQAEQGAAAREERVLAHRRVLPIKAGYAPYVITAEAVLAGGRTKLWVLAGVTRDHAYSIDIKVTGKDPDQAAQQIQEFFAKGVSFKGEQWNPRWTESDLEEYWNRNAPDSLLGKDSSNRQKSSESPKIIRTDHYVVLTNSSSGKLFAKKMEQCYDKIRATFPFEEITGNRLMPVLLFRTNRQYYEFYMKKAKISMESAEASKGHAWEDYYATYYDSPNDPVHVHEATHQIFMNRIFLAGGGSWFQEGVAEYMCESQTDLRSAARGNMRKKDHPTLRTLMKEPSLIAAGTDERGADLGDLYYLLAGSLIACVRESKWGEPNFMKFITAMGSCPDNDLEAIEAALQRSLGFGIDELEKRWQEHYR
ncbi:MAG: hypothetical protein H6807_08605 [Planctomycetes bacterium]|nr:hypothetical protein [Planctomycetota bacterium]